MAKTYKISEVCGDWALHIPPYGKMDEEMILIFNSRNNAELVKSVLEWEDAHPNAAVPYMPTLTQPNEPLSILVHDEPGREYIDYVCPKMQGNHFTTQERAAHGYSISV